MSEVAVESAQIGMDSSPSRREGGQHWVEKSIEDMADDYFSSVNPFAKKIILEKKKCQDRQSDWDHLNQTDKDTVLNDWFIDASLKLKYELKLGISEAPPPGTKTFPKLVLQGGTKTVQYREDNQEAEDGTDTKGKHLTWRDEFSGPFTWETKCQQDLSIFSGESSSSSSTPRHEPSHVDSQEGGVDVSNIFLSPKRSTNEDGSSVMVMKDVTKRRSFGNNLLASLEEQLAFDEAVNKANAGKKDDKDYQHIGQIGNKLIHAGESPADSSTSSGSSTPREARRKASEGSYKKKVSKPKMAPPGPGPKPRDIPKYTDPPMYHKSQTQQPPKYIHPPRHAPDQEPPSQSMDRGRPSVEPPKQPKISKPKMEPPKPKMEPQKPKMEPPRPKMEPQKPKMEPPKPKMELQKPKMEPPKPRAEISKPKVQPPPPKHQGSGRSSRPTMSPPPPSGSVSPRQPDKEKLIPQSVTSGSAREGIPTSTSHDNISLEVKEEEKDSKPALDMTVTSGGAAGAGAGGDTFGFLMDW